MRAQRKSQQRDNHACESFESSGEVARGECEVGVPNLPRSDSFTSRTYDSTSLS
jgi:hypothetical protein